MLKFNMQHFMFPVLHHSYRQVASFPVLHHSYRQVASFPILHHSYCRLFILQAMIAVVEDWGLALDRKILQNSLVVHKQATTMLSNFTLFGSESCYWQ